MTALVAMLGALGLSVAVLALPPFRPGNLDERVEPYISGLHGRASRLLHAPSKDHPLRRFLSRHLPSAGPDLASRIAATGGDYPAEDFRLQQFSWGIAGFLLVGVLTMLGIAGGLNPDPRSVLILAVMGSAVGWLGRDWWLSRQIAERREILIEELPLAIDLITLSIVSGDSVASSCGRIPHLVGGEIGDEFARMVADIRSGSTTVVSLEALSLRVDEPAVSRFVDALCTGLERGAPLAEVLRSQADELRETRKRRLLEMGGRREVLMLVPVVFLIMPVVVVFTLFPGLVSLDLLVP